MRPRIKIPQDIIDANGIEYDAEANEYHVHHPSGMYINIPSNAIEFFKHPQGIIYSIKMGNIVLSLYNRSTSAPHITVLDF